MHCHLWSYSFIWLPLNKWNNMKCVICWQWCIHNFDLKFCLRMFKSIWRHRGVEGTNTPFSLRLSTIFPIYLNSIYLPNSIFYIHFTTLPSHWTLEKKTQKRTHTHNYKSLKSWSALKYLKNNTAFQYTTLNWNLCHSAWAAPIYPIFSIEFISLAFKKNCTLFISTS